MPDTARFAWAEEIEALNLTLVHGLDVDGISAVLTLRSLRERPTTFEEAWTELNTDDEGWFVQLDTLDGWTAIIEDNGYYGSLDEYLGPLSAGGSAVTLFWNVNGVTRFSQALSGEVSRTFDPSGIDWEAGEPLPEEADLDFEDEEADFLGLGLLLMERLTGVTIDGDWVLNRARPMFAIAPS
jgi:Family of unknown function (DUF6461)